MERLNIFFFFFLRNFFSRHQFEKFCMSLSNIDSSSPQFLPSFSFDDHHEILSKRYKWKNQIYSFFLEIFSLVTDSKRNFIYLYLILVLVFPSFSFDDYHKILSKCCKWKDWIYHYFLEIFSLVTDLKNFIYFYLTLILVLPSFSFDDHHEILSKRYKWKD